MSSPAQKRVKGCGKTGQIFTLYHISILDGTVRPLARGFKHLAWGSCASTFEKRPTESCSARTATTSASHPSQWSRGIPLQLFRAQNGQAPNKESWPEQEGANYGQPRQTRSREEKAKENANQAVEQTVETGGAGIQTACAAAAAADRRNIVA
jgi:hypothetical protein